MFGFGQADDRYRRGKEPCLIQAGSLPSPRQAHARTTTNEKEKSKAERSRSRPLSRLGVRPLYPLGGFLDRFRF